MIGDLWLRWSLLQHGSHITHRVEHILLHVHDLLMMGESLLGVVLGILKHLLMDLLMAVLHWRYCWQLWRLEHGWSLWHGTASRSLP